MDRTMETIAPLQGERADLPHGYLSEIYEEAVEKAPKETLSLISERGPTISCQEVNKNANKLAREILKIVEEKNVNTKGEFGNVPIVCVLLPPSEKRIISIVCLIKIHAVYLPLDPILPKERMRAIIQETGATFLLTDGEAENLDVLGIDILKYEELLEKASTNEDRNLKPNEIAYHVEDDPVFCLLFTSGSTGKPKGVKLRERSIKNRLVWQWKVLPLDLHSRGCHKTSVLFVDSVTEILSCLLQAVPLVIISRTSSKDPGLIMECLREYKVSQIVLTPSLLLSMIYILKNVNSKFELTSWLKLIICSGEKLDPDLALDAMTFFKDVKLVNFYGATETTGDITYETFKSIDEIKTKTFNGDLSIGKPVDNNDVYVLNEDMMLCEDGTTGYIYVDGYNIADGYINGQENTTPLMLNCIDKPHLPRHLYMTGDLGAVQEGRVFYQGRVDMQIKIRGQKANLTEIEACIKAIGGIDKYAVLPCGTPPFYQEVVAFYESSNVTHECIVNHCKLHLPSYMVPIPFKLKSLPLQPQTGKIDRQKLKAEYTTYKKQISESLICTPRPETIEEKVKYTVAKELGIPLHTVKNKSSFLSLGGNSINAVITAVALTKQGLKIAPSSFLEQKTIQDVVDFLSMPPRQSRTIEELETKYELKMLNDTDNKEDALKLLGKSFSQKNPLDIMTEGRTEMAVESEFRNLWQDFLDENKSIVVVEKMTGKIVAASLLLDIRRNLVAESPVGVVPEINEAVEDPVRQELLKQGGNWLDSVLNGVDVTFDDRTALSFLHLMGEKVIEIAKDYGYDGIVTVNSHPVTMDIDEHFFGYQVRNILHVKSFEFNGERPFYMADDSYVLKCMTKTLK